MGERMTEERLSDERLELLLRLAASRLEEEDEVLDELHRARASEAALAERVAVLQQAAQQAWRALRDGLAALRTVVEWGGVEHEDEHCPEDDTCECPTPERVNRAWDDMDAALAALEPRP